MREMIYFYFLISLDGLGPQERLFFLKKIRHMFVTVPAAGKFVTTFCHLQPLVSNLFVTDMPVSNFLTDFLSN
jgi:hypothetical protein